MKEIRNFSIIAHIDQNATSAYGAHLRREDV